MAGTSKILDQLVLISNRRLGLLQHHFHRENSHEKGGYLMNISLPYKLHVQALKPCIGLHNIPKTSRLQGNALLQLYV